MNLAVCLAGCLDVTPLKGLFYVVPPWSKVTFQSTVLADCIRKI